MSKLFAQNDAELLYHTAMQELEEKHERKAFKLMQSSAE